jgi:hypothetical protein
MRSPARRGCRYFVGGESASADWVDRDARFAERALGGMPHLERHPQAGFEREASVRRELLGRVAEHDERPDRDRPRRVRDQIRVRRAHGRARADRIVDDRDRSAARSFSLALWEQISHREQAGRPGRFDALGHETLDTQLGRYQPRQPGSAGHRPAHRIDTVRRKAARQRGYERAELVGMVEQRAELEPRCGVIAGFHPEMAVAPGEQRRDRIHHRASMRFLRG